MDVLTEVSTPPRLIHLRRPPVLSVHEGVYVPSGDGVLDDVDCRWKTLCDANPNYFDGRLFHVLGVHRNGHGGATVHVIDCAYRFFAVQTDQFDLGVRALGVKGITTSDDGILMGLRAPTVAFYRDMWEFAPGGSVSPGDDPPHLIQRELLEETGLRAAHEPVTVAVIFDPVLRCWELVYRLNVQADNDSLHANAMEYSQLEWRLKDDLPANLSPIAQQMTALLE